MKENSQKEVRPSPLLWTHWLLAGVLFAVTLAVYLPALRFEFLNWDDISYVVENDHVQGGLSWRGFVWAFTAFHSANWHPVTWLSHMLDCQIFGLNAGGHHFTNAFLHAVNAVLLFLLLVKLLQAEDTKRETPGAEQSSAKSGLKVKDRELNAGNSGRVVLWCSFFIAAVFALHPLRVESVAWVSERKDVLSGLFFMLTLWAYAKYVSLKPGIAPQPSAATQVSGFRSQVFYSASLLFFTLGLMSKPMLVTLPFVLLLLDLWPLRRWTFGPPSGLVRRIIEKLPFFALTIASSMVTFLAQRAGNAVATTDAIPPGLRLQNAGISCVQYIWKFIWPSDLSPLYSYNLKTDVMLAVASGAALLIVTMFVWIARKSRPWLLAGWLWYVGMLVPVIGIVQVGSQALADRYTYLPLIGLCLGVGWEASRRLAPGRLPGFFLPALALIIPGLLLWATHRQLSYWQNTFTLFSRALELDPRNLKALYVLGAWHSDKGEVQQARLYLDRALEIKPDYPEALGTLASMMENEGRYKEAAEYYRSTLRAAPNQDEALNNFAWLLVSCPDHAFRDGPEAVRLATRACEITRYSKPVYIGTLAAAYAEAGDFDRAIATAEQAATLATALNLHETASRNRELIQRYREGKTAVP